MNLPVWRVIIRSPSSRITLSRLLFILLGVLCSDLSLPALAAQARELRGFWVDGFNDGFKSPDQIELLLERVRLAHCNAIFAQMRKGGDACYRSHYEPRAADVPPTFDALDCLIRKAHALQPPVAVHAWLNVCAVGKNRRNLPGHIATLHPDWLSRNARGSSRDPEAAKIDPGCPDAADWTFRVFLDVVRHYDIDGIHLDFVRYTERNWGYNPVSLARFYRRATGRGTERAAAFPLPRLPGTGGNEGSSALQNLPSPTDPAWSQWRRDQVTALVRKIYVQSIALKPKLVVSAALIAWSDGPRSEMDWEMRSAARNRVFQDWRSWLKEGILDIGCPMTYFLARTAFRNQQDWSAWIKGHQYGRAATVGIACWENTIPATLRMIADARRADRQGRLAAGVMLYSYAGTNAGETVPQGLKTPGVRRVRRELQYQSEFYAALGRPSRYGSRPPFPSDVPPPPLPWKEHPSAGHVMGFVLTPGLRPIDGALVKLSGPRGNIRVQRTDGTGFFTFVDLKPLQGNPTCKINVTAPEGAGVQITAKIRAGQVTTVNLTLPEKQVITAGSRLQLIHNAQAVLGTDTYPGNLYITDEQGTGMRVRLETSPVAPFQPGDLVTVMGVPGKVEGETALDHASVILTGIASQSALPVPQPSPLRQVARGGRETGQTVRVVGQVEAVDGQGFVLAQSGARIYVPLAGRKEFPIESDRLNVGSVAPGAWAEVSGVVSKLALPGPQGVRVLLLPRSGADIVLRSLPSPLLRVSWARGIGLLLLLVVLVLCLFYAVRKKSQTAHPRSL